MYKGSLYSGRMLRYSALIVNLSYNFKHIPAPWHHNKYLYLHVDFNVCSFFFRSEKRVGRPCCYIFTHQTGWTKKSSDELHWPLIADSNKLMAWKSRNRKLNSRGVQFHNYFNVMNLEKCLMWICYSELYDLYHVSISL